VEIQGNQSLKLELENKEVSEQLTNVIDDFTNLKLKQKDLETKFEKNKKKLSRAAIETSYQKEKQMKRDKSTNKYYTGLRKEQEEAIQQRNLIEKTNSKIADQLRTSQEQVKNLTK